MRSGFYLSAVVAAAASAYLLMAHGLAPASAPEQIASQAPQGMPIPMPTPLPTPVQNVAAPAAMDQKTPAKVSVRKRPAAVRAALLKRDPTVEPEASAEPAKEPSREQPSLTSVTGLTPAQHDEATPASATAKKQSVVSKEQVSSRWINDLSGGEARLTMGVKRHTSACDGTVESAGCVRPTSLDANLAGIMLTSSSTRGQRWQPMSGDLGRGSYNDGTPGVYLK